MMLFINLFFPLTMALFQQQVLSSDQYTVDDILQRYRNLTESHREINLFKHHPEYDTSCVKSAITPILSQCLKKPLSELDPKMRSTTAARLSICEFEVAQIEYPNECHTRGGYFFGSESVDYPACVMALEVKSQWWTSYSGYYRSIGDICLQESLPYERDEIWNMFMDVTEHYDKLFDGLQDYVAMSQRFKHESEHSFNLMNELMNEAKLNSRDSQQEFEMMWKYINGQLSKVSAMSVNVTQLAKQQTDSLEQNMLRFFNNIGVEFNTQLDYLKLKFVTDLEERDSLMSASLEKTRATLTDLGSLTMKTFDLHDELNNNLYDSTQSARALNQSISHMDDHVDVLTSEIIDARELMTDINDILENNPLVRTLFYVSSQISITLESAIVFMGISSLSFLSFILISFKVNVFKYIGITVVSLGLGGVLSSLLMIIGKLVSEQQLTHQTT